MPGNTIDAFFETLLASSGEFNQAGVANLSFLDGVYLNVGSDVVNRNEKYLTIPYPDVGPFTNQGATDWNPEDIDPGSVTLVFDQRPGKAILVRDYESWQTSADILTLFLDPMYKRACEYFNALISSHITSSLFNYNAPIIGGTPGEVTVADASLAWDRLADAKCPVDDTGDLSLFTHNNVHRAMMVDTQWAQESLVGAVIAQRVRETGNLGQAFNFQKRWSQQAPKGKGVAFSGTVTAAGSSPNITGTGTHFLTELDVGDKVTIAGDATVYTVATITDDTHAAMTTNVTAATGKVMTGGGYTCIAMHRYALALALRPLELINDGTTQSRLLMLRGIPLRVMVSYQHLKGGRLLTVDCGAACGVCRPQWGQIIKV